MSNPQNEREQVQKRIKKLISSKRKEMGMTQMDFADYLSKLTGVSISYGAIQGWEKPRPNSGFPSVENFVALAKLMGVSLDEFYDYLTGRKEKLIPEKFDENRLKSLVIQANEHFKFELLQILQTDLFRKLQPLLTSQSVSEAVEPQEPEFITKMRGKATSKLKTDEIMGITRGED